MALAVSYARSWSAGSGGFLLVAKGYVSEVSFRRAFRSEESLDHFIEELLNRGQPCGILEIGAWEVHPVAGMLREIWEPVVVPAEEGRPRA